MSDTNETLDEGKQPLIQHLVELRSRLIKSLILLKNKPISVKPIQIHHSF